MAPGILYILLFTAGQCLPIVVAGISTAAVRKLLENRSWQGTGNWFRRVAGIVIFLLGIYFNLNPLILSWRGYYAAKKLF